MFPLSGGAFIFINFLPKVHAPLVPSFEPVGIIAVPPAVTANGEEFLLSLALMMTATCLTHFRRDHFSPIYHNNISP